MAEFLVANHSSSNPSGFQAGDIVDMRPDGWNWSASEQARVVKLPAIPFELAKQYREEDREIYVHVSERETKDTSGQLSLTRDGVEVAKVTANAESLIKSRTTSVEDIGEVKILNRDAQELAWEDRTVAFARRRWKMVGKVITDKLV